MDTSTDTHWRKFFHRLDVEVDGEAEAAISPISQCGHTGAPAEVQDEVKGTVVAQVAETAESIEEVGVYQAHLQSEVKGHKVLCQLPGWD